MKKSVKVATNVAEPMINAVEILAARVEKAKEDKKPIIQSYKQQLEDNKKYKSLLDEECRKLGYALSLMKKFEKAFSPVVVSYIERIQSENVLFKLCEVNCPRTKSGNYSVWLLQSYIRKCLNA
jgi:hypothetical protein